jgi:hypothetical protein
MHSPILMPSAEDARPVLAVRVGVTGHCDLAGADMARLASTLDGILADIERAADAVTRHAEAAHLYADTRPLLRLVTSLAEGADRAAAEAALARNQGAERTVWRLAAPLPFAQAEYEKDFNVDRFRELLAIAGDEVIELDGDRAHSIDAYREAGLCMLRNSDVVIAIYDKDHANKPAGAREIMECAARMGLPLIVVNAKPPHDATIGLDMTKSCVSQFVRETLDKALLPAWPKCKRQHDLAARVYLTEECAIETGKPADFLYGGPFAAPASRFGGIFPWFVALLSWPKPKKPKSDKAAPATQAAEKPPRPRGFDSPAALALYLHHQRADALAVHYANLHRSGFVMIYLLAGLALGAAAAGLAFRQCEYSWIAAASELALLGGLAIVLLAERGRRWRERWLDYRLLAEELRQADLLALLGRSTPHDRIAHVAEEQPETAWVAWLARAILRSAGLVRARYDREYLVEVRDYLASVRLPDQIAYHRKIRKRNEIIDGRLRWLSLGAFVLTMIDVALELIFHFRKGEGWDHEITSFLAVFLPAAASIGFGVRNQAEFELMIGRSDRYAGRLIRQANTIRAIDGSGLTSAALGKAAVIAVDVMRGDTADWATIFEAKASEPP